MSYLEIKNLSYTYAEENTKALKDINLSLEKGEITLILGKSGSGKSTLGKCITGSIPAFYGGTISGNITVNGRKLNEIEHKDKAKIVTMVFQDPEKQLIMNKVHREIAFGLENVGAPEDEIKRRVWESLQFCNILNLAYRDIDTLSGGEKQKVSIASAIAYHPSCIILDEPTSQLDPNASEEIISLIKKVNEELGITVAVIEQKLGKWFENADKVVILKEGELYSAGLKENIYRSNDPYSCEFLPGYLKLLKLLKIEEMPKSFKSSRTKICKLKMKSKVLEVYENDYSKDEKTVSIKNLSCFYGKSEVVRKVSFEINKGEMLGLIGANGAGKSTILKSLMGFIKYSGSIKVLGSEVKSLKMKELSRLIGYVSQNPNDYISKETVWEEIKFTLNNFGIEDNAVIEEVLKTMDLYMHRNKNPRDLSGGEKQRVAIASILVLKPKILLLDEPTRGLDSELRKKLGSTLKNLNHSGTTIILITHDMEFAAEFCDKFALMFNGEIVAYGDRKKVLGDGIYYTTDTNKLFRELNDDVFTIKQAIEKVDL